jgi:hypothetical protein
MNRRDPDTNMGEETVLLSKGLYSKKYSKLSIV